MTALGNGGRLASADPIPREIPKQTRQSCIAVSYVWPYLHGPKKETTMNPRTAALMLAICTTGVWTPAHAQNADSSVVKLPQDMIYEGRAGAPQHVTLFGDPSKPGLYVDRIKFMPGMKVMPHWHPDTVRTVLVMSGTFYFAVGEQWDESKLKAYPAGTLYSEPARSPHYAWAKDGEVILQVTGIGPTGNVPIPQKSQQ